MIPASMKLLEFLTNRTVTFFIPPYQRNYEWTSDQCEVFLDDVVKTAESNQKGNLTEHFFGSITYFKADTHFGEPDKLVLIDGQQRITTTMLFLAALRDISDDQSLKAYIDSDLLKNDKASGDKAYQGKAQTSRNGLGSLQGDRIERSGFRFRKNGERVSELSLFLQPFDEFEKAVFAEYAHRRRSVPIQRHYDRA
jgi:hypothetical protein